jgi:hypothetical protein
MSYNDRVVEPGNVGFFTETLTIIGSVIGTVKN